MRLRRSERSCRDASTLHPTIRDSVQLVAVQYSLCMQSSSALAYREEVRPKKDRRRGTGANKLPISSHTAGRSRIGASGPTRQADLNAIRASGDLAGQKHCSRRHADIRFKLQSANEGTGRNVVDGAVSRTPMQPEITTASKSNQCGARDRTYAGNKIAEYQQKSEPRHMYRCYLLQRRVDLHILAEAL